MLMDGRLLLPGFVVLLLALLVLAPQLLKFSESGPGSMHAPLAVALIAGLVVLIVLLIWLITHSYLIRQKIAGMRSRRMERRRYRTIHDTRKSRRRKRIKKSKHLRF